MTVGADLRHRRHRKKINPVPKIGQEIARLCTGRGVERGSKRADRLWIGLIGNTLAAPYPVSPLVVRHYALPDTSLGQMSGS